jgi:predicted RNA-binding protein (virulence factor B family)
MKKFFFFILLLPSLALALVAGPHKIMGKVRSFDEKTVTLDSEKFEYVVPKELTDAKKLKIGNEIEVLLSEDQISKVKITKKTTKSH